MSKKMIASVGALVFVLGFLVNLSVFAATLPVNLGTAGNFTVLAKSEITTTGATLVTGDIGVSPAAATFIQGFSLTADPSNKFSTSIYFTGKAYASNYAVPTPTYISTAEPKMLLLFLVFLKH